MENNVKRHIMPVLSSTVRGQSPKYTIYIEGKGWFGPKMELRDAEIISQWLESHWHEMERRPSKDVHNAVVAQYDQISSLSGNDS